MSVRLEQGEKEYTCEHKKKTFQALRYNRTSSFRLRQNAYSVPDRLVLIAPLLKTICLWVVGAVSVNLSSETLSRAYYGCFSESTLVPSSGWMAFDQGSTDITVHCVVPKKVQTGFMFCIG